jgi:alginate O-acetyltransferase complex protein AlgI
MIFNELLYPVFLCVAVVIFFALPGRWRPTWLTLSGLLFYAYYADIFLVLFAVQSALIYALMRRWAASRGLVFTAIVAVVAILGYYKYRNMALFSWSVATGQPLPTLETLILPLAISFFTFEFIHYLVDSHRKQLPAHNFSEYGAFMLFFPTMVAGPIKRFQDFLPKLRSAQFEWGHIDAGLRRIVIGCGKKILIADSLTPWVQPLLEGDLSQQTPLRLALALLAYSAKIYLDFSGYSDIAIGSARLFGIVVPENFSWPYLKANIAEFWRHWHISLTSWITDYVFKPLGGSRVGLARTLLNTCLAMAVSGLWHGAAWHFLVWGLWHGILLCIHRLWRTFVAPKLPILQRFPRVWQVFATALTFACVTLGWGLFIMPVDRFVILCQRLVGL